MCGIGTDDKKDLFDQLRQGFNDGFITKEEYAFTLRTNQAAFDETKSEERELYKNYQKQLGFPQGRGRDCNRKRMKVSPLARFRRN